MFCTHFCTAVRNSLILSILWDKIMSRYLVSVAFRSVTHCYNKFTVRFALAVAHVSV